MSSKPSKLPRPFPLGGSSSSGGGGGSPGGGGGGGGESVFIVPVAASSDSSQGKGSMTSSTGAGSSSSSSGGGTSSEADFGGLISIRPIGDAALGGDRKIRRPGRRRCDDGDKFFERAKSLRDLANKLIVQVRDGVIAGGFEAQHGVAEDVAADRLSGILSDEPAERAALLEDVVPLPSTAAGVTEREAAAGIAIEADVFVETRIGVADASAARQFKMEELLVALKCNAGGGEALVVFVFDGVHRLT